MHRDGNQRGVPLRPGSDVHRKGGGTLEGNGTQTNLMQQVWDTGSAIVDDLRVRPKNTFLEVGLAEEQAQQPSRIRSSSAPLSSCPSERSARSSSSMNSDQKRMMFTSSGSSSSKPLILRGPPAGGQDADRGSDDDVFTMSHDGGTCSNSFESDTDDVQNSEPGFLEGAPAYRHEGAEALPSPADDGDSIKGVPQGRYSQLPSFGSINHASGTCKPCTFASGGRTCKKGVTCNYCHLQHNSGPSPSKKTRPCKEKRLRQKQQMERIYAEFERDPEGFDVEHFKMPTSLLNTSLETELMDELRRRKVEWQSVRGGTGASSSSSQVPVARSATRCWL